MTLYRTIVADPPWPMKWSGGGKTRVNGRGERHINHAACRELPYPTMTIGEIGALPVGALADSAAHLYLWTPDVFLIDGTAAAVARAWGFKPGRLLIWHKTGFGFGRFPRPQHEAVVVCRRGSLSYRIADTGSVQSWKSPYSRAGRSAGRQHSRKPDGFLDLVERASPGPYLELFARRQRLGWDTWGDEALGHVEMPVA